MSDQKRIPETQTEIREIEIHHEGTYPLIVKITFNKEESDNGIITEICYLSIEEGERKISLNPKYARKVSNAIFQLLSTEE